MRRDDLGGEGEKLAAIDALVFGHARPLQIHLWQRVLHEQ
jgi:hypothetical protein